MESINENNDKTIITCDFVITIGNTVRFQKYLKLKFLMTKREELVRKAQELVILKKKDKRITGLVNTRRKIRLITNKFNDHI
jgi:hypothetical protein